MLYGVFVVTNFWKVQMKLAQGKNAIEAGKKTGIQHFILVNTPQCPNP